MSLEGEYVIAGVSLAWIWTQTTRSLSLSACKMGGGMVSVRSEVCQLCWFMVLKGKKKKKKDLEFLVWRNGIGSILGMVGRRFDPWSSEVC